MCACDITRMMPTRTCRGWKLPADGDRVPNLSRLRRWGCNAYVLVPKADRRKEWEDKAMVDYYIGYSKTKVGYRVLLGDIIVTSVCVLFDESIPERYFREQDEATVKCDPEERLVSDFDWWQHHKDGGLFYKTTWVVVRRGLIVGFRALVTAGKQQVGDKTPIHIADIQSMTEEFLQRLRKKPSDHDGGTGGDALTAGMGVTPLRPKTPRV